VPVRGAERLLCNAFDPLDYAVEATRCSLDERPYFAVTIQKTTTLADRAALSNGAGVKVCRPLSDAP
jgi:hypothetical protein